MVRIFVVVIIVVEVRIFVAVYIGLMYAVVGCVIPPFLLKIFLLSVLFGVL